MSESSHNMPEAVGLAGNEPLDAAIAAYLGARADTRQRLDAALAGDPACAMTHCLDGYVSMTSSTREGLERARAAVRRLRAAGAPSMAPREAAHVGALEAWSRGDMRGATRCWDALLAEWPRDLVAIKASQFVLSYLGESDRMRSTVAGVVPAWNPGVPGYGFMLGCYAYALEEAGDYALAEEMGQRAVELNPADIWAAHAVAHVREMQGRLREGIQWISTLGGEWQGCGSFARHLRWHEALYHLELEQYGRVLELYDRDVHAAASDEYLDLANAASLLWRLEQADVDVGQRWRALAEQARAHVGDHSLVFVDLHYLMALAAVGDDGAIEHFLTSCDRFVAAGRGTEAEVMKSVGVPLAQAVVAHRRRAFDEVVDRLIPVRRRLHLIGGSRAQRDVFEQLLIDAAVRSRRFDVAAMLLGERTLGRPGNRWGWRHHAAVLDALGAPGAMEAHRELDRLRAHG